MALYKHHWTPSPNPPKPLKLGEIDDDWIDDLHRRLFLEIERELSALEHAHDDDPKKDMRETLDLMERALRVKRLMGGAPPKRARKKRNGRRPSR